MRALRFTSLLLVILSLMGGNSAIAVGSSIEPTAPILQVVGNLDVHSLPGGTFDVQDRIFQYRDYPVAGSGQQFSDPRLSGNLTSYWSWDVQASGDQPVPAWGNITIDGADGSWQGDFTGIRPRDFEPVGVRALLYGDGAYEGLCATLDITVVGSADDVTWVVDGVVHPVAMTD